MIKSRRVRERERERGREMRFRRTGEIKKYVQNSSRKSRTEENSYGRIRLLGVGGGGYIKMYLEK
jgi:hypothetical protein